MSGSYGDVSYPTSGGSRQSRGFTAPNPSRNAVDQRLDAVASLQHPVAAPSKSAAISTSADTALVEQHRREMMATYQPGAVQYRKPAVPMRQQSDNFRTNAQLRSKEAPLPADYEKMAEEAAVDLKITSRKLNVDAGKLMDKVRKAPILRIAGKLFTAASEHSHIAESLRNGLSHAQVDGFTMKIMTPNYTDMRMTIKGLSAMGTEGRSKEGWYQQDISATDLAATRGSLTVGTKRKFDKDRAQLVYYYGAQMFRGGDLNKKIMAHPSLPISYIPSDSFYAAKMAQLGHTAAPDEHGMAGYDKEIVSAVIKGVDEYLTETGGFLDLNKLEVEFEPIGSVDELGNDIPHSALFNTPMGGALGNKVIMQTSLTFQLRTMDIAPTSS